MSFAVVVTGLDSITAAGAALADTTALKQAILEGALQIQSTAIDLVQHAAGGGRTYTHHKVSHEASLPGNPPRTDTGQLVSSIQYWTSDDGLSIAVGTTLDYGKYLEYGTRDMAARPFMTPAVDMCRDDIIENITAAVGAKE